MYSIFIEYFRYLLNISDIDYLNLLQKNIKFDNFIKKRYLTLIFTQIKFLLTYI